MCGIAGIYNYKRDEPVSREELSRLNAGLTHRGPDDEGLMVEGTIGLAMRRLAIIDVAGGHQPMGNAAKTVWIVFNGEIYNFPDLRRDLEAQGHVFVSASDTEVLLRLYEVMGPACVHKLRGMFAFAIWDKKADRLFVARDRLGKKPLVYTLSQGQFCWSSEIRPLASMRGVSKEMDVEALDLYMSLQYIPSPRTIYKAIRKLPPAHTLTIEKGQVRIERYWAPPSDGVALDISVEEAESELVRSLKEATRIRMISDVPLGAFLSGGLDSTCVVGLMSQLSERPIKTFAIGFEEDAYSELPFARAAARHFSTDHTEFVVKPNMVDVLPKLAAHYGEPFGDSSAFATYFLARETRKHVTVALNGDGGDENFAGYKRYLPMKWDPLPSAEHYLRFIGIFKQSHKDRLYSPELKAALPSALASSYLDGFLEAGKNTDRVNRWLHVDLQSYLPECLMTKVDIATMANSLEGRSPFLDHVFVEWAHRLRGSWKLKGLSQSKWILRRAFNNMVPPAVLNRKKMGFGIPLTMWFRDQLKNMWSDCVLASDSISRRYFQEEALKRLLDDHVSGKKDHGYRLWNLLMLEMWAKA